MNQAAHEFVNLPRALRDKITDLLTETEVLNSKDTKRKHQIALEALEGIANAEVIVSAHTHRTNAANALARIKEMK